MNSFKNGNGWSHNTDFRQRYVYFVIPRKLLQLETATVSLQALWWKCCLHLNRVNELQADLSVTWGQLFCSRISPCLQNHPDCQWEINCSAPNLLLRSALKEMKKSQKEIDCCEKFIFTTCFFLNSFQCSIFNSRRNFNKIFFFLF